MFLERYKVVWPTGKGGEFKWLGKSNFSSRTFKNFVNIEKLLWFLNRNSVRRNCCIQRGKNFQVLLLLLFCFLFMSTKIWAPEYIPKIIYNTALSHFLNFFLIFFLLFKFFSDISVSYVVTLSIVNFSFEIFSFHQCEHFRRSWLVSLLYVYLYIYIYATCVCAFKEWNIFHRIHSS